MTGLPLLLCMSLFCFASADDGRWQDFESMVQSMNTNAFIQDIWDKDHIPKFAGGDHQEKPEGSRDCPPVTPSPAAPISVHALRPSDVRIVAAIGDSLTAGNGALAKTPLGLLTEYRGRAFAMGGDGDETSVVTMPNLLRGHSDQLEGHSVGTGKKGSENARLNFAVPGSTAQDLEGQALELVDRLRRSPVVDFHNDWKVITVFVGGNDACDYFDKSKTDFSPEKYLHGIRKALDIFHASVPKTFVNLVEVLDLSMLPDLSKGIICPLLHRFLCKNIASGKNNAEVKQLINDYNAKLRSLVATDKYETRDDFTVVVQPFFRHTTYPKKSNGQPDWSFFAPDCFHFSAKGHAAAGEALWNNMLEPVGQKELHWSPDRQHVKCPTDDRPFLATNKNSPGGKNKVQGFKVIVEHDFLISNISQDFFVSHISKASTSYSSSSIGMISWSVAIIGGLAFVVTIIAVYLRRRRNWKKSVSFENLPREIEDNKRREVHLDVPTAPMSIANELFEIDLDQPKSEKLNPSQ